MLVSVTSSRTHSSSVWRKPSSTAIQGFHLRSRVSCQGDSECSRHSRAPLPSILDTAPQAIPSSRPTRDCGTTAQQYLSSVSLWTPADAVHGDDVRSAHLDLQARVAKAICVRVANPMARVAKTWWNKYQRALDRDPVKTKALTSCFGLVLADIIAQAADPGAYDPLRTMRMAAFGLGWHGIAGHFWYEMLDRVIMPARPKATGAIVGKMLLDQLVWSPVNTIIFYAALAAMEGNALAIPSILHDKLVPTVLAGYMLWPAAHVINFKYVRPQDRLLYINVVNLFWSVYLVRTASAPVQSPDMAGGLMTPIPVSSTAPPPPPPIRTA